MGEGDFDEGEQRLGLGVVVLLELGSDGLDLLRVGCEGGQISDVFLFVQRVDSASTATKLVRADARKTHGLGSPRATGQASPCPWLLFLCNEKDREVKITRRLLVCGDDEGRKKREGKDPRPGKFIWAESQITVKKKKTGKKKKIAPL